MTVFTVIDYFEGRPAPLVGVYSTQEKAIDGIIEYLDSQNILQEYIEISLECDTIEEAKEYYREYYKNHEYNPFTDIEIIATELI